MTIFPTDTTGKTPVWWDILPLADSADSNALKDATITEVWTTIFWDKTTSDLSEWTNEYYTEVKVSANTDVAANTSARHTHSNKAVLDATTASFTTTDEIKLDGSTLWPASATDNALVRFDSTTWTVVDNWVVTETDTWILQNIESADFDLTPASTTHTDWRLRWSGADHTLDLDTDLWNSIQLWQELGNVFTNTTGSIIPNWSFVKPSPTWFVLAQADLVDNISWVIFMTTTEVAIWWVWAITIFGKVRGVDTSLFTAWEPIYISPTNAWEFTQTKLVFPNYSIEMGIVETAAVDWTIWVNQTTFVSNTFNDAYDWSFRESLKFTIASDGATITGSLVNADLTNDLTMIFSDGLTILDVTPALTITLTQWTDTNPQENYIYIPLSTKVLTVSTTDFPASEHIKVAYIVVRSATATVTDWALVNQNVNDHIKSDWDNGHLLHISERLRLEPPKWRSWAAWSAAIVWTWTWTPDTVTIANTSWVVYQLHDQVFPALDMASWDTLHIVNDSTTAFKEVTNLWAEQLDALWVSLNNTSYSIVVWGIQNKTWTTCHLMANLPTGSYAFASPTDAVNDADNQSVYDIPALYTTVWFLIARFTFTLKSNENVLIDTQDLRGKIPNTIAWWGWGGWWVTDFTALSDVPSSYVWQANKILQANAWETALEFIDNSALNTETDITNFNNNLSAADTDVQKALDTIDNLSFGTTDTNAIHDNVAAEISVITEKWTPVIWDMIIIEDSADANNKKMVQVWNLPTAWGWETNTASNVWTAWVWVFKQKTWVDLEFKKLNAWSSKITITDDTWNDEVDVDVVEANLTLSSLGWAVTDAQVPNDITLDNITQITNRSHTWLSDVWTNSHAQIDSHIADTTTNPHSVTATNVWLWNVDNTSDATKNSATATLTNKTIALSNNTVSWTTANFNAALSDWSFTTLWGTETLTNKTLTDPKIVTTINNQTWTTYTLALTDHNKLVRLTNAAAIALTIPTNASVAIPIWAQTDGAQQWAGAVTIWWAWITINSKDSNLTTNWQWVWFTLIKVWTDEWDLYGDLI